ncbi:MAG: hypothetical protein AAFV98_13215 [Chloroflexota bacterium]
MSKEGNTPLYKKVAKAIEVDCINNKLRYVSTNRYYDFRFYPRNRIERRLDIECSYSTLKRAFDYLVKQGKMEAFGNAHTVTLYIYIPELKAWALKEVQS